MNAHRFRRSDRPLHALLAVAGLLSLAGCASVLPPERTEVGFAEHAGIDQASREIGLQVLTIPEGQRVMLIKSPEDVERVCSPRESDQGLSVNEGLSLSLPGAGGAVGVGETLGDQAVAIGHPTAIVQLARELLFRACELSLNLNADAEETRDIYERFLVALEAIAPALQVVNGAEDDDDDDE